ncbi:aspartate kinase [Virgibacillus sp. YIM 98842]|uniref:aspartate kinase n=1 Tax=Virgibacillus sp. YIM 98842 TaxID=2663533 RepID=UPI0013DC2AAE|nr:aspartate kinase [Virgibacillus sp. YIM 98842]
MKVSKFGGTSVANAAQIKKVANIVTSDPERKFIVVSAPGKRSEEDFKVTDMLIQLGNCYLNNEPFENCEEIVMERFREIVEELNLPESLLGEINDKIKQVLQMPSSNTRKLNALKAIGEDSSAKILSEYLKTIGIKASYVNPKDAGIIVSYKNGNSKILPESYEKIHQLRNLDGILVIPGFFGYTEDGQLVTFSRGGSDISGSIIAAGVKASLYENFTDVDSVYAVNPKIVKNPKKINTLTYKEMRELSYAGFSVFHDEALRPAFDKKIPVCIKNTNKPELPGTMIIAEKKQNQKCVAGIASDTGFSSLYISKYLMNQEVGFGRKLFGILEDAGVSFEHAPSGIDDMTIIIRDSKLSKEKEAYILKRIEEELDPDTIKMERGLAIVMVVGEGLVSTIGIASKATAAISNANVNIEMINQGSSEVSMMFGIKSENLDKAVRSLYNAYFEEVESKEKATV